LGTSIEIFEDVKMICSMFLGRPYYACNYLAATENHKLMESNVLLPKDVLL